MNQVSTTEHRAPGPGGLVGARNLVRFATSQLEWLRELADRIVQELMVRAGSAPGGVHQSEGGQPSSPSVVLQ